MHLPAMMGLVVEHVQQRQRQLLLDVAGIADGAVADGAGESLGRERGDIGDDARILRLPGRTQMAEVVMLDSVEPGRARSPPVRRWFSVPCTEPKNAP